MNPVETTNRDPLYSRLAALSVPALDAELAERIRRRAHVKLVPRRFSAIGTFAVSLSVALYLSWALGAISQRWRPNVEGKPSSTPPAPVENLTPRPTGAGGSER